MKSQLLASSNGMEAGQDGGAMIDWSMFERTADNFAQHPWINHAFRHVLGHIVDQACSFNQFLKVLTVCFVLT